MEMETHRFRICPAFGRQEGDCECKAGMGYAVRPYLEGRREERREGRGGRGS